MGVYWSKYSVDPSALTVTQSYVNILGVVDPIPKDFRVQNHYYVLSIYCPSKHISIWDSFHDLLMNIKLTHTWAHLKKAGC